MSPELLLQRIQAAGSKNPIRDLVLGIATSLAAAGVLQEWLAVPGLSLAAVVGVLALEYEVLLQRASRRQKQILESWPIVLESLESAAISGMSILESLRDLAESEQLFVSREFAQCCREIDSGIALDESLRKLKGQLSNPAADATIELILIANQFGSAGYVSALRIQATNLRLETNLLRELSAKQGWVVGTAKLAVAAPWLIVSVLSVRTENAEIYRSISGTSILLLGMVASSFALWLVYNIGKSNTASRVFA